MPAWANFVTHAARDEYIMEGGPADRETMLSSSALKRRWAGSLVTSFWCMVSAAGTALASGDDPIVPSHHANDSLLESPFDGPTPMAWGAEARTIDGSMNNAANPSWGSADTRLLRLTTIEYGDGISTPAGSTRPSPRVVSNVLSDQTVPMLSPGGQSDMVWQWGQFLDHDIDLSEIADPQEVFNIPVPTGDPFFDPLSTGTQIIKLDRSAWDSTTGTSVANPRRQKNFITSYIDASNVYGSDQLRADELRLLDGSGKLKTSAGDLPPFNINNFPNAGGYSDALFLAGDIRSNEQIALTAMHTLFVREHNRQCDLIDAASPGLSGEEIYQRARAIVGAQIQVITYKEWLPVMFGQPDPLGIYAGYDPLVNAAVSNVFATAAYRMGHSMLPTTLARLDQYNFEIFWGNVRLKNAFFKPERLVMEGGIDPILRGLAHQTMQVIDSRMVEDVRNFLFGQGTLGFDLASLNIQRGRDHGLADYNQTRIDFGLAPVTTFAEISSDPVIQAGLASLYASVDDVDVWVGGLAEDPMPGALVGELVGEIMLDQFRRLRDGDRFWYQNYFSGALLAEIEATRLGNVIRRNTGIADELQSNVFYSTQLPSVPSLPALSRPGLAVIVFAFLVGGIVLLRTRLQE